MKNEEILREELEETIKDTQNLTRLIQGNLKTIDQLGRELLEELKLIRGWEVMIDRCKDHYKKYPNEFFSWCSIDYSYSENLIRFIKTYSDDDEEYIVLTIRLGMNLAEQVIRAKELYGRKDKIW